MLHFLNTGNTPSQSSPTAVIIVVTVVSIMILMVISLGVAVGLKLGRINHPQSSVNRFMMKWMML